MMTKLKLNLNILLATVAVVAMSFAGLNGAQARKKRINRRFASTYTVKSLDLFVGIDHDEDIPLAPKGFSRTGTYKKFLKLSYNPSGRVLRITPKKVGVSTLAIKHPRTGKVIYEYRIDIKTTNLKKVAREMHSLLKDIEGVKIKILNNKVVVDGEILLPQDMNRIHSVVKQYGERASSLVTLSPLAQSKIAEFIERAINNPEIHVKAVNGKFILEGLANSPEEKDKAEILAKTYVPDVIVDEAVADKKVLKVKSQLVINLIKIKPAPAPEPKKIVQLVVHYVELQKDYTRGFRFQWMPDLGDGSQMNFTTGNRTTQGGVVSTITGTIRNLLPKLNWAKEHGHARVLQSSSLIVQDGQEGILNSLTRVPYQVVNGDGQPSTSFEDTGLKITITPQILGARSDSVRLNMNFTVKALINYTEAGPLTSQKDIKTIIVVRSHQSAAVGGLISNETGTGYNRLPANVSPNPIISLYASKDFRRSQSQFVTFVTPIIKVSASQGADKIKRKFRLRD